MRTHQAHTSIPFAAWRMSANAASAVVVCPADAWLVTPALVGSITRQAVRKAGPSGLLARKPVT